MSVVTWTARTAGRTAGRAGLALLASATSSLAMAAETQTTGSVTGFYYAMPHESDFGVAVATLDHGSLHLEARYNYEVRNAGSAFIGWRFSFGEDVRVDITPIVGAMFDGARGVVPGVEASIAWREFDAYVELEYVDDRAQPGGSYYYAWSEVAWRPNDWLRIGLVGQRTRTIDVGREWERGIFGQVTIDRVTLGVFAFNPGSSARYLIGSLGMRF